MTYLRIALYLITLGSLGACSTAETPPSEQSVKPSVQQEAPAQSASAETTDETGNIQVVVNGLKSDKGTVRIGLYDDEQNYLEGLRSFRHLVIPIEEGKATCTFEDIPFGEYAITLYHDENENIQLDRQFTGIPKESYGFSNNVKPKLGMPAFEKTKFVLDEPEQHHKIEVQ